MREKIEGVQQRAKNMFIQSHLYGGSAAYTNLHGHRSTAHKKNLLAEQPVVDRSYEPPQSPDSVQTSAFRHNMTLISELLCNNDTSLIS